MHRRLHPTFVSRFILFFFALAAFVAARSAFAGPDRTDASIRAAELAADYALSGRPDAARFELVCEKLSLLTDRPVVAMLRVVERRAELTESFAVWLETGPRGAEVASIWFLAHFPRGRASKFIDRMAASRGRDREWVLEAAVEQFGGSDIERVEVAVQYVVEADWDTCESARLLAAVAVSRRTKGDGPTLGAILQPLANRVGPMITTSGCWPEVLTGIADASAREIVAGVLLSGGCFVPVAELEVMVQSSSRRVVHSALALAEASHVASPIVERALVRALEDSTEELQFAGLGVVSRLGARSDSVRAGVTRVARAGRDSAVRIAAVNAVAQCGGAWALSLLLELAKDADLSVRAAALAGLGALPGSPAAATQELEHALDGGSDDVAIGAAFGLLNSNPMHKPAADRVVGLFAKRSPRMDASLAVLLETVEPRARQTIAEAAIRLLATKGAEPSSRVGALHTLRLAGHRDPALTVTLQPELASSDPVVRALAEWVTAAGAR